MDRKVEKIITQIVFPVKSAKQQARIFPAETEPMIAEKNRQEVKIGKVESSSNPIALTSFSMGDGYPRLNPLTKEPRLPAIEAIRTGNILACCFADLTTFLSIFDF